LQSLEIMWKLQVLIVYIYFILSNCRRNIWGKVYWILT